MADHVDANPSKGAGKSPRVSCGKKRSTVSRNTTHSQPSLIPLPIKRKSSSDHKNPNSKNRRLEEDTPSASTSTNLKQSKSKNSITDSKRELRKRKPRSTISFFSDLKGKRDRSESEEDEVEIVKTERDKKSRKETIIPSTVYSGTSKTSSRPNLTAGGPASSSCSSSNNSTGSRYLKNARSSTSTSSNIPTRKSSKVKNTVSESIPVASSAPSTTSEEETKDSTNISGRLLRLTASRAAAAASLRTEAQAKSKLTSKPIPKPLRGTSRKGSSSGVSSSTNLHSHTKEPEDSSGTNPPTTTTDTDEPDEGSIRIPYQLRSHHCSETVTSKSKSSKDKGKKNCNNLPGFSAGSLRSAHILSEKEKNLQRKSGVTPNLGNKNSSSGSSPSPSTSSGGSSTRSGRPLSITTIKSPSTNTGACTSSSDMESEDEDVIIIEGEDEDEGIASPPGPPPEVDNEVLNSDSELSDAFNSTHGSGSVEIMAPPRSISPQESIDIYTDNDSTREFEEFEDYVEAMDLDDEEEEEEDSSIIQPSSGFDGRGDNMRDLIELIAQVCNRGGVPSGSGPTAVGGPLSGSSSKPGEAGMNNQTASTTGSSSNTNQGTSSSSAAGASGSSGGESSGSGTAASSAFSRGLAMLAGDSDGDENDMGRLQALLESRGLPPHLFGSLAPRMQQFLNRGMNSTTVSKAQQLLTGLQASGDEGQQLQAAIEMCQLLVMGNEDTLAGFPVKQTVPALITLLAMEHNFDMMNHACRALTYMMEALPRSTPVVAEAVPVFLEKLQVIQCMDVAEQSLTALEMLSRRHAKTILQANGVSACLTYLDFFSITAQRAALAVTANCCQSVHIDEFSFVSGSIEFLAGRLTAQDKKSVESVCLTFSRLVDSFTNDKVKLEEIASSELLANVQQLLVVTPPLVSTGTFILVLRLLAQVCSRCPKIALKLLEQNIVSTLSSLLLGSSTPNTDVFVDEVELVARNPQELLEIVTVIGELLPKLPKDGIFAVNTMMTHPHLTCQDAIQWQWRDDRGGWNSYSAFDSRIIEAAHQSGEDEISLTLQATTYTIDFLGMQQLNEESGTARPVQRKINPFYNPRVPMTTESVEKEVVDVRSSYLELHPDFTLPFLRPLFALLSEANSSSAGPAVRQNCVKTLLRIVHFLPAESLQKTLRPQQVSNNLASMLGSSDLKIVVGAFQLSCLFMEKLTDVYMIHFRREGVFHQVSRISTSEVVGPSPIKSEIATILGSGPSGSTSSGILSIPTVSSTNNNPSSSAFYPPQSILNGLEESNNLLEDQNNTIPIPSVTNNTLISQSSPFGLSLHGFYIQPTSLGHAYGGLTGLPPLPPTPDQDNLNIRHQGFPLDPSTATPMDLAIGSTGQAPPLPPPLHSQAFTTSYHTRGMSSASSLDSGSEVLPSTPPSGSGSGKGSSGSSSQSEKKSSEADLPQAGLDPFKRKRTSKRPIPTSTSRRLRQEDPSGQTYASVTGSADGHAKVKEEPGTTSNSQSQPAGTTGRRSSGKSSGFFASLHPSRWTRGSVPVPEGAAAAKNNNNNTASSSSAPNPSNQTNNVNNLARAQNSSAYLAITYKEQIKGWLKEQSLLFSQKYYTTKSGEGMDTSSGNGNLADGTNILPKLGEIISDLKNEKKVIGALEELRTIVLESDISPFEINHSGLIGALLGFLVDEEGYSTQRDQRLRSFIHVFANCPLNELSGEKLEDCFGSGSKTNGLSTLVSKLNSCFSQLEQFQVKVHEVPTSSGSSRVAPSSALRFFNTHQLKCVLQRHPNCTSLRQWKGGPVKIDPLALVQAIERYLIVRGFGRPREPRDSGDSDEDNSDDDIDDSLAAVVISQGATRHKLQFIMNDQVLPYNMTVYQAIRQYGAPTLDLGADMEGDFIDPTTAIGSSGIWSQTHTIYYRPLSEDGVSPAVGGTSSKTSSKKSKSPSSKAAKAKKDPLWHDGIAPLPTPPYVKYLTPNLEPVTISDPSLPVLTLLRVIHAISRYWHSLYWPVLPGLPLIPHSEFINTKVAAKAQRQLQDPVVIMTGNLPSWLQQIGMSCPFLFPFETRHMLFYSTSFDRDRALQRLLDSVPELNSTEREDRVTPRLDRRKRTISRDQILAQAEQLMQDFGSSRPLLEVQYENEVGTGLGPTLEFYALVSQELQKKELDLWHCESSHSIGDEITDVKSKSYITTSVGLFPKPLGKSVKTTTLSKVKQKFKFIGRFMAKAVMDSRMIDIPLSKTQYKWILGGEGTLNLDDMSEVDSTVAQSIRKLVSVVSAKKKLEQAGFVGIELQNALENLTLDGCRIDNLGLDFTLPGHPSIELRKGGRDTVVTIHNLEEYIKLVIHWMLISGVHRQMEAWREGFDAVFPSSSLRIFYPEELEMVFCGANQSVSENWDMKTLSECCRPDHGFTNESRAMQFLYEVMSSYDAQERRKFIQFVTGTPRLPVGGFKALQPPLTIVRKTIENGDEDSFLPSVMTCVNYLKLPDYSTIEIMRDRLRVAAEEGQMSFHLS